MRCMGCGRCQVCTHRPWSAWLCGQSEQRWVVPDRVCGGSQVMGSHLTHVAGTNVGSAGAGVSSVSLAQ